MIRQYNFFKKTTRIKKFTIRTYLRPLINKKPIMQGNQIAIIFTKKANPFDQGLEFPKRTCEYLHGTGVTKKQGDKQLMLLLNNRQNSSCKCERKGQREKQEKKEVWLRMLGKVVPACFFSVEEPLCWRISRSTRPRDINPRVRPDIIPAKRTSKQEIPA